MKRLVFYLGLIVFIFSSCTEDNECMNEAQITGPDFRQCLCCGGWFIEINCEDYRFYELPKNTSIDLNTETFPLEVELDWHIDSEGCLGDEIIIESINKR